MGLGFRAISREGFRTGSLGFKVWDVCSMMQSSDQEWVFGFGVSGLES